MTEKNSKMTEHIKIMKSTFNANWPLTVFKVHDYSSKFFSAHGMINLRSDRGCPTRAGSLVLNRLWMLHMLSIKILRFCLIPFLEQNFPVSYILK